MILKIKDLPDYITDVKEQLIMIEVLNKFMNYNLNSFVISNVYNWEVHIGNEIFIIPKNVSKNLLVRTNIIKSKINKELLLKIQKLNVIVDGINNNKTRLYTIHFIENSDIYNYYLTIKNI
jgi:hypothetical protein